LLRLQPGDPRNQLFAHPGCGLRYRQEHSPLLGVTSLGFANAFFVLPLRCFVVVAKIVIHIKLFLSIQCFAADTVVGSLLWLTQPENSP
jgi:hypothetical protein